MTKDRIEREEVWTNAHRRQVQTVYGMVVGGVIVLFGLVIISWAVIQEGDANLVALSVGAGVCLVGLVASMPKIFMPILSFVMRRLPFMKSPPPTMNEITAMAEAVDLSNIDLDPIERDGDG